MLKMEELKEVKKLVVYYSFEGNTKLIGETIANSIEADLLELKPQKELSSKGFAKYFWGGSQVMMKKKPDLLPLNKNPLDYDIIFIGTPVWAWTYAPPLKTFFSNVNLSNKKIGLFSCNGGQNGKTFQNMKAELGQNVFIGEMEFFEPLVKNREENIHKAKEWVKDILKNL